MVFKNALYEIAAETIDHSECIASALVHMQKTLVAATNPQTAIAAPQEATRPELCSDTWKGITLNFAGHQLLRHTVRVLPERRA